MLCVGHPQWKTASRLCARAIMLPHALAENVRSYVACRISPRLPVAPSAPRRAVACSALAKRTEATHGAALHHRPPGDVASLVPSGHFCVSSHGGDFGREGSADPAVSRD